MLMREFSSASAANSSRLAPSRLLRLARGARPAALLERVRAVPQQATASMAAAATARSLRVLSWNTSNARQSDSRPKGSGRREQEMGFADTILRLLPDVVCLQELQPGGCLPGLLAMKYSGPHGYARSHMGFSSTWVLSSNKDLAVSEMPGPASVGPSTLLKIESSSLGELVVANCHLEPFKEGAAIRLETLKTIQAEGAHLLMRKDGVKKAKTDGVLIIAGDMNMRVAEDKAVTGGLSLKDSWEAAGKDVATKYSWNTKKNEYYTYSNQYNARYDRIYFQGGDLACNGFQLVGDEPASKNPGHFLSDHFGIMATFTW